MFLRQPTFGILDVLILRRFRLVFTLIVVNDFGPWRFKLLSTTTLSAVFGWLSSALPARFLGSCGTGGCCRGCCCRFTLADFNNHRFEFDIRRLIPDDRIARLRCRMVNNKRWRLDDNWLRFYVNVSWFRSDDDWRLFVHVDDLFRLRRAFSRRLVVNDFFFGYLLIRFRDGLGS